MRRTECLSDRRSVTCSLWHVVSVGHVSLCCLAFKLCSRMSFFSKSLSTATARAGGGMMVVEDNNTDGTVSALLMPALLAQSRV